MYMYYYYHEYMSEMSRSRQRVCLAQRVKRRRVVDAALHT